MLFQKYAPTGTGTEVLALLVPSYMSKEAAEGRELCGVWMCPRVREQSQQFLCLCVGIWIGLKLDVL